MQYEFDGYPIYEGDQVFVVGFGPAKVIDTRATYFRAMVTGRVRKISYKGVQSGEKMQSVFWANPIVSIPAKDNDVWREQRQLSLTLTDHFTRIIKNHPTLEVATEFVEDPTPATPGQNAQLLESIVNKAREDNDTAITNLNQRRSVG